MHRTICAGGLGPAGGRHTHSANWEPHHIARCAAPAHTAAMMILRDTIGEVAVFGRPRRMRTVASRLRPGSEPCTPRRTPKDTFKHPGSRPACEPAVPSVHAAPLSTVEAIARGTAPGFTPRAGRARRQGTWRGLLQLHPIGPKPARLACRLTGPGPNATTRSRYIRTVDYSRGLKATLNAS